MKKRYLALVSMAIGAMFVLAACSQAESPTSTSVVFDPTPDGGGATATPTTSTEPTATASTEPTPTEPAGEGDPVNGEALFNSNTCSACHSTGDNRVVGPGLQGVYERAATRVAGQTADEYITESIHDPNAYVVDGYGSTSVMTAFPNMSASDVNDIIAYLKTLN